MKFNAQDLCYIYHYIYNVPFLKIYMYLAGFRPSRFSLMFHFQNYLHRHTLSEKNGTMEHYFIINDLPDFKKEHCSTLQYIARFNTKHHQITRFHIT